MDLKSKPDWFFPLNPYGRVPTLAWADGGGAPQSLYEVRRSQPVRRAPKRGRPCDSSPQHTLPNPTPSPSP